MAFHRIQTEIEVGKIKASFVKRYEVETSFDTFTDTAKIFFPRQVIFQEERKRIEELVNVGDRVVIRRGYAPEMEERFVGYVARIKPDVVTTIECEDAAFLCKRTAINYSKESVTIKQLIADNLPAGLNVEAIDANVGSFRVKNFTLAQILEKIRSKYGLRSWFKGTTLLCGLPYIQSDGKKFDLSFQRDVPLGKGSDLVYLKADDTKLKVKAVSILPDNTKLEVEVGDPDGAARSYTVYNIRSVTELKKVAEENLNRLKYEGFRGSFEIFGSPMVNHGDQVRPENKLNPEQFDGSFYAVKGVSEVMDVGEGLRQTIELGQKVG